MDGIVGSVLHRLHQYQSTDAVLYKKLSSITWVSEHNRIVLKQMSEESEQFKQILDEHLDARKRPQYILIKIYTLLATVFGVIFILRLLINRELRVHNQYLAHVDHDPAISKIISLSRHKQRRLLSSLDEERVKYLGSIVLGINDALVEITGTLAGLTLAFNDTRLIAVTGIIMGCAASLSMASSQYLALKAEGKRYKPLRGALYTGSAYFVCVLLIVAPFVLLSDALVAISVTVSVVLVIVACFTWYLSVVKQISFSRRFVEMAVISIGVATISFVIGSIIHHYV